MLAIAMRKVIISLENKKIVRIFEKEGLTYRFSESLRDKPSILTYKCLGLEGRCL